MEPNFSPDGSSDIEQELGEGIEGGETLGEEVETVKTTVGEEKDAGHASDAESLATTISLGPPWQGLTGLMIRIRSRSKLLSHPRTRSMCTLKIQRGS